MNRQFEIRDFVDSLAAAKMPDDKSINIYEDQIRCGNLMQWLRTFEDVPGSAVFVGEAPGVKGARITGVGFTSPATIKAHNHDPWQAFGSVAGYEIPNGENDSQGEPTATVFWKHVGRHFADLPRPLTWNAYPFWPHRDDKLTNRQPTGPEILQGSRWLRCLVDLYPSARIAAVGRSAEKSLKEIGVKHTYIRHPSHGGVPEFIRGVERFAQELRELRSDVDG